MLIPDLEPGIALCDVLVMHYDRLASQLARHLGCPHLASECLHDAWLRLNENAADASVRNPLAYIRRVACNLATDRLRSSRPWQYASDADVELDGLADPAPGPALIAEMRSDVMAVERALQRLPRRHRAVLMALRFDEMSRQEVADRYRLSLRGVDTALRQALDHCVSMTGCSVPADERSEIPRGGPLRSHRPPSHRAVTSM
ncbi:RNA polymerase sigma factor [Variovorax sp.]|jgi:RNA polymerase sigma factor (sigma-70 family)|uniref:RNA polymerase sigma factor n=1 Tax=Variovorax sp. TaxID=1871043 RepID=UPI0037DA7285